MSIQIMPVKLLPYFNYCVTFMFQWQYWVVYEIADLKPQVAITLLPGLPAYILFMCVRHTDFINDEEKVNLHLLNNTNVLRRDGQIYF